MFSLFYNFLVNLPRFIKYAFTGTINTSIEATIFLICYSLLKFPIYVANSCALGIVICIGFLLHHKITFNNNFFNISQTLRYTITVSLSAILNFTFLYIFLQLINHVYVAKLIQIILVAFFNFNMYKYYVYINKVDLS